jgi:hypothetical protein
MDTVLGFVRHALTFGGGFLVTNGTVTASDLEMGIGAIVTLIGLAWSIFDKKKKKDAS